MEVLQHHRKVARAALVNIIILSLVILVTWLEKDLGLSDSEIWKTIKHILVPLNLIWVFLQINDLFWGSKKIQVELEEKTNSEKVLVQLLREAANLDDEKSKKILFMKYINLILVLNSPPHHLYRENRATKTALMYIDDLIKKEKLEFLKSGLDSIRESLKTSDNDSFEELLDDSETDINESRLRLEDLITLKDQLNQAY